MLVIYIFYIQKQIKSINKQINLRMNEDSRQPIQIQLINKHLNTLVSDFNRILNKEENLRIKTISRRSAGKNGREFGFHFIPESSDEIPWQITTKENIACFSAIGCVMGAKLCQELQVPIGVISCNFGATRIQPWISPETIKIPVFAGDEERFKKRRQALGTLAQEAWKIYQRELEVLLADRDNFVEKSLDDPLYYWQMDAGLHWPPEYAQGDQNEPCCLYRLMLARVIPFAMRGVVWYQGESSATIEDCNRYAAEMEALIDDWRKAFENDDLVFPRFVVVLI